MFQTIINRIRPKMEEILKKLEDEFRNIRTGRANTNLIENLKVSYYGTETPLKQMASLTTPTSSSILITPWDQSSLGDIEQAIGNSDLGLNPINDGRNIRINLPPLTEERRSELVKMIGKMAEETKVGLRIARQEAWEEVKKLEQASKITEDDRYRAEDELNKVIDDFNKKIEEMSEKKEAELMKI